MFLHDGFLLCKSNTQEFYGYFWCSGFQLKFLEEMLWNNKVSYNSTNIRNISKKKNLEKSAEFDKR